MIKNNNEIQETTIRIKLPRTGPVLRNAISIVNQEPILFNMSIKENLLMVNPEATDKQIKDACKLANIDDFIETLPNKYDEVVLENNSNLSVGQKQRLAIARVIFKKILQ